MPIPVIVINQFKGCFFIAKKQEESLMINKLSNNPTTQVKRKKRLKPKVKKALITSIIALPIAIFAFTNMDSQQSYANVEKVEKQEVAEVVVIEKVVFENEEKSFPYYNPNINMPIEHQEYLYGKVVERNLDYNKVIALIETESGFDSEVISSTEDYGYFQINRINHETLAGELNTLNEPLDPYVNIEWGTYMLADLYEYWEEKGIEGESLDHYVWSSYNKGITGFIKNGAAKWYISKIEKHLANQQF